MTHAPILGMHSGSPNSIVDRVARDIALIEQCSHTTRAAPTLQSCAHERAHARSCDATPDACAICGVPLKRDSVRLCPRSLLDRDRPVEFAHRRPDAGRACVRRGARCRRHARTRHAHLVLALRVPRRHGSRPWHTRRRRRGSGRPRTARLRSRRCARGLAAPRRRGRRGSPAGSPPGADVAVRCVPRAAHAPSRTPERDDPAGLGRRRCTPLRRRDVLLGRRRVHSPRRRRSRAVRGAAAPPAVLERSRTARTLRRARRLALRRRAVQRGRRTRRTGHRRGPNASPGASPPRARCPEGCA
jgi:hypothetical protein